MSVLQVTWLTMTGALFAVWTVLMFSTLIRLRRDAVEASGRIVPGVWATLESFAGFLRRPGYATDRKRLGWLTLALFAVILCGVPWA